MYHVRMQFDMGWMGGYGHETGEIAKVLLVVFRVNPFKCQLAGPHLDPARVLYVGLIGKNMQTKGAYFDQIRH